MKFLWNCMGRKITCCHVSNSMCRRHHRHFRYPLCRIAGQEFNHHARRHDSVSSPGALVLAYRSLFQEDVGGGIDTKRPKIVYINRPRTTVGTPTAPDQDPSRSSTRHDFKTRHTLWFANMARTNLRIILFLIFASSGGFLFGYVS